MVPVLQNIRFASRGLSNSLRCFKVEKVYICFSVFLKKNWKLKCVILSLSRDVSPTFISGISLTNVQNKVAFNKGFLVILILNPLCHHNPKRLNYVMFIATVLDSIKFASISLMSSVSRASPSNSTIFSNWSTFCLS